MPSSGDIENLPRSPSRLLQLGGDLHGHAENLPRSPSRLLQLAGDLHGMLRTRLDPRWLVFRMPKDRRSCNESIFHAITDAALHN